MSKLIATPDGAGRQSHNPAFRSILINLVTPETRAHERTVNRENTWPTLPAHLRDAPDWRAMIRHWVRTDYQWRP